MWPIAPAPAERGTGPSKTRSQSPFPPPIDLLARSLSPRFCLGVPLLPRPQDVRSVYFKVASAAITSVQAVYVPADDMTDPAVAQTFTHLDASIVLSRGLAARGLSPAIDPSASTSRLLDPSRIGTGHYQVALAVKETIERYRELQDIIAMLGLEELSAVDQVTVKRARRLEHFLT